MLDRQKSTRINHHHHHHHHHHHLPCLPRRCNGVVYRRSPRQPSVKTIGQRSNRFPPGGPTALDFPIDGPVAIAPQLRRTRGCLGMLLVGVDQQQQRAVPRQAQRTQHTSSCFPSSTFHVQQGLVPPFVGPIFHGTCCSGTAQHFRHGTVHVFVERRGHGWSKQYPHGPTARCPNHTLGGGTGHVFDKRQTSDVGPEAKTRAGPRFCARGTLVAIAATV